MTDRTIVPIGLQNDHRLSLNASAPTQCAVEARKPPFWTWLVVHLLMRRLRFMHPLHLSDDADFLEHIDGFDLESEVT